MNEDVNKRCLVLAVDDDVMILAGLVMLLQAWGCEVIAANSYREAIEKVNAGGEAPHAVVVDYRLQGKTTGLMVLAELREKFGMDFPAVVITGDTLPDKLREIVSMGVPILHKPVDVARLEATVKAMCKKRSDRSS